MDVFNLDNKPQLKASSNNSILALNDQIEKVQNNDPLMKTYYPMYLYNPPFGYPRNINVIFMRELAKNPYVFAVLKAIIDQAAETKWEIKPKEGVKMTSKLEEDQRYITEFFKNPNSDNESFAHLLRKILPDILTLDSGIFCKVYNKKKELCQLRVIDGGTILKNPDRHGSMASRVDIVTDDAYFGLGAGKGQERLSGAFRKAMDEYQSYGYIQEAAYFQFAYGVNYSVPIPYGKKEIVYIMENPSSETVYSRISALQAAVDITLNLIYSSKASLDLFLNANIPTGIIQIAEASQQDTEAFQNKFYQQQYSGFDEYGFQRKVNGRLPIVGNPNVNFIPLNFSSNETQLLQIQEWFTKVLWSCFGVTADEMGFSQDSNKAVAQTQTKVAARKAVIPRLSMIAATLNDQVLPELPSGDFFEFVFDTYDVEDDTKKWALYESKIRMGVMTPQMVAEKEGIDVTQLMETKQENMDMKNPKDENPYGDGFKSFGLKAAGHKYVKRTGSPGNYTYFYKDGTSSKSPKGKDQEEAKPEKKEFNHPMNVRKEYDKDFNDKKIAEQIEAETGETEESVDDPETWNEMVQETKDSLFEKYVDMKFNEKFTKKDIMQQIYAEQGVKPKDVSPEEYIEIYEETKDSLLEQFREVNGIKTLKVFKMFEDKPQTKSVFTDFDGKVVVSGDSKADVLFQTVKSMEEDIQESIEETNEENDSPETIPEAMDQGMQEQEMIEQAVVDSEEYKSEPAELPKTPIEIVMEEYQKEIEKRAKSLINKTK